MTDLAISQADVVGAADRIAADVVRTASALSRTLSTITGCDVVIKFENQQFTGSFKDRGAANFLRQLPHEQRPAGVVAMSAGNHARGVAYHAGRLDIPATIVMPTSAPFTKVSQTRAHGATVIQEGRTLAQASAAADRVADESGAAWIHPYDDPQVIAGQGTVAVELLEDHPELDTVVVPTGGGGLLAGMATYIRAVRPDVAVYGVQTEAYPGMVEALRGRTVEPGHVNTLADGIAVKRPGKLTVPIVSELVEDVLLVPEASVERAVALLIEVEKTVAEGAGAVPLAALLHHTDRFAGRHVGLVLSGGNIDTRVLASVLMRELVTTGRISTLRISLADLPGQLAPVVAIVADSGANIIEIDHRRLFDPISARATNVDLVVETRDGAHAKALVADLEAAGYDVAERPS